MVEPDVGRDIRQFAEGLRGLMRALSESSENLKRTTGICQNQLDLLIGSGLEMSEREGKRVYRLPPNSEDGNRIQDAIARYREFVFLRQNRDQAKGMCLKLPQLFFLALVSVYDAYLGSLTNSLLSLRSESVPEAIDVRAASEAGSGETEHRLKEDSDFPFTYIEGRFNVELASYLSVPGDFTEIIERRNLYFHCGGIVTARYLEICEHNGVKVEEAVIGHPLPVSHEYFCKANALIYEIGIKLGHLLWRQLIPQQIVKANGALQDMTFKLIEEGQYILAGNLLEFANTVLLKYADENNRLVFLVNRALAAYLAGDKVKCNQLLNSVEWESKPDVLRLAHVVLTERYGDAAVLMRKIGPKARPSQNEYLRWPLFEEFRKTPYFAATFLEVFGDPTLTEPEVR